MKRGDLIRGLLTAALLAGALPPARARSQEAAPPAQNPLVRVYLLGRADLPPITGDVAASLTLQYRSGRGETLFLPRLAPEARVSDGPGPGIGMIRGLVGSRSVVELFWKSEVPTGAGDSGPRAAQESPAAAGAPATPGPGQAPDPRELLRRAHQGPSFAARIPASKLAHVASAWVTVRRGDETWTSEEFQGPSVRKPSEEESLAGVERHLGLLFERAVAGTTFMMVRPQTQLLLRDLAWLAPYGFLDGSGAFEDKRQSCLAMARSMEDACAMADWGRLETLTLQSRPQVQGMEALHRETPRPDVPTLDHEP